MTADLITRQRKTTYNSTSKKLAVQWVNKALCFVSNFEAFPVSLWVKGPGLCLLVTGTSTHADAITGKAEKALGKLVLPPELFR